MREALDFLKSLEEQGELSPINVGVFDSGIRPDHIEFSGVNIAKFYDFISTPVPNQIPETPTPFDNNGHGTAVTGIIAGAENGFGAVGLCLSALCNIYSYKVLNSSAAGTYEAITAAMQQSIIDQVRIVNISIVAPKADPNWAAAIAEMRENGIIVVASTGNNGANRILYPAGFQDVIAIGGTNKDVTTIHGLSNFADFNLHFVAPFSGQVAPGHNSPEEYVDFGGTSAAAPWVTGIIAAMLQINENLTQADIVEILKETAIDLDPLGKDPFTGYGAIDPLAALQLTYLYKKNPPVPTPTTEPTVTPTPTPTPQPTVYKLYLALLSR